MTSTETRVLTTADAIALGELLIKLTQKSFIRWMGEDGGVREGEMRSLVKGDSHFGFMDRDQDVRDAYVWITSAGFEYTVAVAYLVTLFDQGGIMFEK